MSCEELRDIAPEIALGTVDGEERADALRHLATCTECRRFVDQLSEVADELLMLAPVQEPPAGFESRVITALGLKRRPPRRRAPASAGPARAAGRRGGGQRGRARGRLSRRSRHGRALPRDARAGRRPLLRGRAVAGRDRAEAGVVFGYQGAPSWMLVTVDPAHRDRVTSGELVTKDRRTIPIASFELDRRTAAGAA